MADNAVARQASIAAIYQVLLRNREIWLDPEDALAMAQDLFEAGFRRMDHANA